MTTLLDDLRHVPLFGNLTDEKLQWIAQNGTVAHVPAGQIHAREGDPVEHLHIVLDGELRITKQVDGADVVINTFTPGTFFGEVPLLLGTAFLASGWALSDTRIFKLDQSAFRKILLAYPEVSAVVLATMADRISILQSVAIQREKLMSLGTLAAGFAHELNNPAAAARRASERLRAETATLPQLAFTLSAAALNNDQAAALSRLAHEALMRSASATPLDPLAQSDLEDAISRRLDERGVDDAWQLAPTFVEARLNCAWLDEVASLLPHDSFPDVIRYLAALITTTGLAREVEQCSSRIAALVDAIRSYTYLDRAPEQDVDLHEGLESTLTMLSYRLEGISVTRNYDPTVPRIAAFGSELNQVWTNLLDNAIDALNGAGAIHIRTACENDRVLLEIQDTGPGIPPDIQSRIWEPFFTTKDVGQGSGLGLDISYRIIVGRHNGDIRVVSQPGDTRFQVRLPIRN